MEIKKSNCSCSSDEEMVVFTCSGASDLGETSDKLARKFRDNGTRNMKCLAMIAAEHQPLLDSLGKSNILLIDGCPIDCGKKIMEKAGITDYNYVRLTDYGFKKGETPPTEDTVNKIFKDIEFVS